MEYKEYRKFFKTLCCFFKRKFPVLSIQQIEDVVSDVIILSLQINSQKKNPDFSSINHKLVFQKSLDKLRYLAKTSIKFSKIEDCYLEINFTPEQEFIIDINNFVNDILSKLPDTYKDVLQLLLDGYSQREIAKKLNISVSAAEKRVQRLRKKLIEIYKTIL